MSTKQKVSLVAFIVFLCVLAGVVGALFGARWLAKNAPDVSSTQTNVNAPLPDAEQPYELQVTWDTAPTMVSSTSVAKELGVPLADTQASVPTQDPNSLFGGSGSLNDYTTYFHLGVVSSGPLAGRNVYGIGFQCDGPCFQQFGAVAHVVADPTRKQLLGVHLFGAFDENSMTLPHAYTTGTTASLNSLDLPGTLATSVTGQPLTKYENGIAYPLTPADAALYHAIGSVEGKTIYERVGTGDAQSGHHELFVKMIDGGYQGYQLTIPFLSGDDALMQVVWNTNPMTPKQYQAYPVMGCGLVNTYNVIDPKTLLPDTRLVAAGKTPTNEILYELKDTNSPEIKKMFDTVQSFGGREEVKNYTQFGAGHPAVFWKDPFGRWIQFTRVDFSPAVECGKPVIYLYPEKTTPVTVFLGLKGKLTVSEPTYEHGWRVTARPDGYVVNSADGKTYPNLYWEGNGVGYETPTEGFVVAQKDIASWMQNTLAKIGFTARESMEFREFWLPRLPKTPYVFITFVPQKYFDRDAPLTISPKPDTVTRVFMEYRGMETKENVVPLALPKIVRKGFTVVEWGGALRK